MTDDRPTETGTAPEETAALLAQGPINSSPPEAAEDPEAKRCKKPSPVSL